MFDTLHAQTQTHPERSSSGQQEDLDRVHRSLTRAWALGVSLGGSVQQRERLLRYTVLCVARLLSLLRVRDSAWVTHALHTLSTLLSFLPWDAGRTAGRGCLGITVELTRCFVDTFLPLSSSDLTLSSQNFSAALVVLQRASQSVDRTYSLPPRAVHHGKDGQLTYSSDIFSVPLLQDDADAETRAQTAPSNRYFLVYLTSKIFLTSAFFQSSLFLLVVSVQIPDTKY